MRLVKNDLVFNARRIKENDKFPTLLLRRQQKRITENTMLIFLERHFSKGIVSREADYLVLENIQSFISKRN
jgi:hypothetical protein